jgi:hypothetical protein
MPFVMGVETSYLPDELLLEGVVLVDLQANELRVYDQEQVAPLPEAALSRLRYARVLCIFVSSQRFVFL